MCVSVEGCTNDQVKPYIVYARKCGGQKGKIGGASVLFAF